ncbi:MAG TPA: translation initiation factor IF-2, partial [Candidatus Bathyarchaeota archaeon]|nr:translation initiation factor IF-2 [Candidatus Bathyarchaeota archaeon]
EGIPDLISVLIGLTQAYLERKLQVTEGAAKGTILEVREEIGLGMTVNVILFDGVLKKGDTIVLGGKEKPIITRVRAILLPKPLDEIRDPRDKFTDVESVSAAAGVKIVAPNLEEALAGSPLYSVPEGENLEDYVKAVTEEVEKIKISTEIDGIVLKTDTLGSLEALVESLRRHEVPVRLADVGDVSKRDVMEALVVKESEPLYGVILAFNVKVLPDAELEANNRGVKIFRSNIIYHLLEDYLNWFKEQQDRRKMEEYRRLIKPAKIRVLPGYVFRKAKPAIFGVEVLAGSIKPRVPLITERGRDIGEISQIQDKGKPISEASMGMQVAISMHKPIVGRHVREGETLYVRVPQEHAKILTSKMRDLLSEEEVKALNEYLEIVRRKIFGG